MASKPSFVSRVKRKAVLVSLYLTFTTATAIAIKARQSGYFGGTGTTRSQDEAANSSVLNYDLLSTRLYFINSKHGVKWIPRSEWDAAAYATTNPQQTEIFSSPVVSCVASGRDHVVMAVGGKLYAKGSNEFGQLGMGSSIVSRLYHFLMNKINNNNNSSSSSSTYGGGTAAAAMTSLLFTHRGFRFVDRLADHIVIKACCGEHHTAALTDDGSVLLFGRVRNPDPAEAPQFINTPERIFPAEEHHPQTRHERAVDICCYRGGGGSSSAQEADDDGPTLTIILSEQGNLWVASGARNGGYMLKVLMPNTKTGKEPAKIVKIASYDRKIVCLDARGDCFELQLDLLDRNYPASHHRFYKHATITTIAAPVKLEFNPYNDNDNDDDGGGVENYHHHHHYLRGYNITNPKPLVAAPPTAAAAGDSRIKSISCAGSHCAAIDRNGRLYTWGKVLLEAAAEHDSKANTTSGNNVLPSLPVLNGTGLELLGRGFREYYTREAALLAEEEKRLHTAIYLPPRRVPFHHKVKSLASSEKYTAFTTEQGKLYLYGSLHGLGFNRTLYEPEEFDMDPSFNSKSSAIMSNVVGACRDFVAVQAISRVNKIPPPLSNAPHGQVLELQVVESTTS